MRKPLNNRLLCVYNAHNEVEEEKRKTREMHKIKLC